MVLRCCAHRCLSAHSTSAACGASAVFRRIVHIMPSHTMILELALGSCLRCVAQGSSLHIASGLSMFCLRFSEMCGRPVRTTTLAMLQVGSQSLSTHARMHARTHAAMVESIQCLCTRLNTSTVQRVRGHNRNQSHIARWIVRALC